MRRIYSNGLRGRCAIICFAIFCTLFGIKVLLSNDGCSLKIVRSETRKEDIEWKATRDECSKIAFESLKPGIQAVNIQLSGIPTLYVYGNNDIVSSNLINGQKWEQHEINELLWAMRQPVPYSIVEGGAVSWGNASDLMVDVGANVGWITFSVASHGYRVAAFEGMESNLNLFQRTLCTSQTRIQELVTLYRTGLGPHSTTCFTFSGDINVGDGHTDCTSPNEAAAVKAIPSDYKMRNKMFIRRMDELIHLEQGQDIKALKVDTEGFELPVIQGTQGIFAKHRIWFMIIEFNPENQVGKELDLLHTLIILGYKFGFSSFRGPFVNERDLMQLKALFTMRHGPGGGPFNLFCVDKVLFEHGAEPFVHAVTYETIKAGNSPGEALKWVEPLPDLSFVG